MQLNPQIQIYSRHCRPMWLLHSAAAPAWLAPIKDRFCARECNLSLMLSYTRIELSHMVHTRPLVFVAVGRDRYSVGY